MTMLKIQSRSSLAALVVMLLAGSVSLHGQSRGAEDDSPPDGALDLYWRLVAERQAKIAEMWETGKFETDSGGMIPMSVLQQGRKLGGPVLLDPFRRGEFDAWCKRMELTETVPGETIEAIWQNYVNRINRVLLEKYPPVFDLSAFAVAEPPPWSRAAAAAYEEAMDLFKVLRRDVARTEDQMFRALAVVDQGQFALEVESLQRYRSWARSMQSLHPAVSGSDIHLSRLLDGLEIDWPNAYVRQAYEMEIASASERLASNNVSASAKLMTIHAKGFFDDRDERYEMGSPQAIAAQEQSQQASRPVLRQQWRRQRELYTINSRYLTLLSVLLDPHNAERMYDTFTYQAFRDHFPNPYDLRQWFDQVTDHDAVGAKLRRDLSELRKTYLTVQRGVDDSLIRMIHRQEGDFFVTRAYHPDVRERQQRELENEVERRRVENAFVFARYLVELLDGREKFDWVKEELEELLEAKLDRW